MNMHTFMIACTAWVLFYIVAGLVTALYFSNGTKKSLMVLFMIGIGWWVVWFCVIGGMLDAKKRDK